MVANLRATLLLGATLILLNALFAFPQETTKSRPATETRDDAANTAEKKSTLANVTRVNTAEVTKKAATEATAKKSKPEETQKAWKASADSDVMEFRPAAQSEEPAQRLAVAPKPSRKAAHGEAYGALDPKHPGTHRAGGAAGATSKSGKTSVYVETDQSKSTSPTPH